jgi:Domain of unknown function (DUF4461)
VQAEVTGKHLASFLPDAIELARQGDAVHHSMPAQQQQSMQSAFWLARRLRVVLEDPVRIRPPAERVVLLEALARAVDESRNSALSRCTIVIGEGAGIDVLGRVWLPHDLPGRVWADTLAAVDAAAVWHRQEQIAGVRTAETAAAAALGVDSVFTTSHLALVDTYSQFLQVRLDARRLRVSQRMTRAGSGIKACAAQAQQLLHMLLRGECTLNAAQCGCTVSVCLCQSMLRCCLPSSCIGRACSGTASWQLIMRPFVSRVGAD